MNSNIESIIGKEGFYLFTGSGNSMWPLIRDGIDTVEVRQVSGALKSGDVILFRKGDKYVLHRLVRADGRLLYARGDNNYSDENVQAEAVIGVMTALWRGEEKISLVSLRYRAYTALFLKCPRLFKLARKFFWK